MQGWNHRPCHKNLSRMRQATFPSFRWCAALVLILGLVVVGTYGQDTSASSQNIKAGTAPIGKSTDAAAQKTSSEGAIAKEAASEAAPADKEPAVAAPDKEGASGDVLPKEAAAATSSKDSAAAEAPASSGKAVAVSNPAKAAADASATESLTAKAAPAKDASAGSSSAADSSSAKQGGTASAKEGASAQATDAAAAPAGKAAAETASTKESASEEATSAKESTGSAKAAAAAKSPADEVAGGKEPAAEVPAATKADSPAVSKEGGGGTASEDADGTASSTEGPSDDSAEASGPSKASSSSTSESAKEATDQASKATAGGVGNATIVGDDISLDGSCSTDIKALCDEVELGELRVVDCLADVMREQDSEVETSEASGDAAETPRVSDACQEEVMEFKIKYNLNIHTNKRLAKACAPDTKKYCNITRYNGYRNGTIVGCLRDVKEKLQPACKKEIFRFQMDAAYDYRADPMLYEACKDDVPANCKDVRNGGGRVQACLMSPEIYMKLSWDCHEQLFRKELDDTEDVRLSVRLFNKCLADKKQFCSDVPPGFSLAKQCLEEHRDELSPPCRQEVDAMIERRMADFRLDTRLRKACEKDILLTTCSYIGDPDAMDSSSENSVANCLQDFSAEIVSDECRTQVWKYMELAAQDVRFDVPLARDCAQDRQLLCAGVPPGDARVIRCLQSQRERLTVQCRATLFDEEVRFSENIDFQYPMKTACEKEISRFCKDVPHGNARVIRCLQENKGRKDFGKACNEEVKRFENLSAKDYRLNFRISKLCKKDVAVLCKDLCKVSEGGVCGGKVLRCLSDNKDRINATACHKEVSYYEKMGVEDLGNDVGLAEACRGDVDKFCSKVEPGQGRMHACLTENRDKLSDACRREELRLETKEFESVGMSPGLLRACKDERGLFCRRVAPGQARVFRCLVENMASADFGDPCKEVIMKKLNRRQANWRLDPPLRQACKDDVEKSCSEEDATRSENGAVKKCLVAKVGEISEGCRRELGRSLHMSFFVWRPKGVMTAPCDADIQRLCLAANKGMEGTPGAVGSCLQELVGRISRQEEADDAEHHRRTLLGEEDAKAKASAEATKAKAKAAETAKAKAAAEAAKAKAAAEASKIKPAGGKPKEDPQKAAQKKAVQQLKKAVAAAAAGRKVEPGGAKVIIKNAKGGDGKERQKQAAAGAGAAAAAAGQKEEAPQLSEECRVLAMLAEPPDMQAQFQTQLAYSLLTGQLEKLETATGIPMVERNVQGGTTGVSLTGWTALLGMAALLLVLFGGVVYGVRQYLGWPEQQGYSLVMKTAPK